MNNIKSKICEIGERLYSKGVVPGASGNISFRIEDKVLITGSGTCLGTLSEDDIVLINMEGASLENGENPSSEKFMHIEIYKKRPDINCIIHAHPPKATALSIAGRELRSPIVAEATVSLGEIPIVPYETPSTHKLAQDIATYFDDHEAVLMANHGATVCGKGLEQTLYKMETLEALSDVFITTELLGSRNEIPAEKLPELMEIRERIKKAQ